MGNLSTTTYDNDLYKHFYSRGYKIAQGKVMIDQTTNQSKGYGYLNFHNVEEAQRCLSEMKNTVIDGRQVVVSQKKDSDFDTNANILVRNLPKDFSQDQLQAHFKEFGDIISCKLDINNDGTSRQQGYVQFKQQDSAQNAISKKNGTNIGEKVIQISIHAKREIKDDFTDKQSNLFVKNIPSNYTDDQLTALFAEFGEIVSVKCDGEKNQGYVKFKDFNQANAAIEAVHMKKVIDGKSLFVNKHISKQENEHNVHKQPPITQ